MPTFGLSEAAQQDLREIKRYTRETWGASQARDYLLELTATFTKLSRRPKLGRKRDDLDLQLRSFVAGQHVIFFQESSSGIDVVRVLHSSMDISRHFEGKG
ncbi:MAG: toxin ParE1 [Nitrospirales bacterium]|nr:MAG: toxin ParE1 [Nitrospirales bacterium]